LRINPCKTCQPVGAMYAALGVHGCMPYSHGSQGCASYHRTFLSRHFKEPAISATSSFTEGASVFGGGSNLRTGARNVFDVYDPEIIAVHTTCLSETIGDDMTAYIQDLEIPDGKRVIHTNTPSYVGSHINGYYNMMSGFIRYLAEKSDIHNGRAAVFPGFVNPGDMREIRRMAKLVKAPITLFPDTSGVMDAPMTGHFAMYPSGGTPVDDVIGLGDCKKTIALGELTSEEPAIELERKCGVEYELLPLPIGIEATDRFLMALARTFSRDVPYDLEEERGQLVDMMLDAHFYLVGKRVAIFGDPDTVIGLTAFALELGLVPAYVLTGTPGERFDRRVKRLLDAAGLGEGAEGAGGAQPAPRVKSSGDLFELHQWMMESPVDLMIGTSYGKQIAKAMDVPFVRAGFPVLDRYAHPYFPIVGYRGAMRLFEQIANAVMDRVDRDCADEDLEVVM
jgi:nitrogenase molybdenum-iron protein beta chain